MQRRGARTPVLAGAPPPTGSRAPPPPALGPRAHGRTGRARPYLFQVALAQARRCWVPRSSAEAAAGSLLPRSLRLGELMNFNLRRVLIVTLAARAAPTRARRRALRHAPHRAAGPGRRCALYEETWERAGSRSALRGPAPAPRLRPGPGAGRPSGLIIAPSSGGVEPREHRGQRGPGANRGRGRGQG